MVSNGLSAAPIFEAGDFDGFLISFVDLAVIFMQ